MNRSGYTDDNEENTWGLWRGAVISALRGKRGRAFLEDLIKALDVLPAHRLIVEELQAGGEVCAIGSVGLMRGIDMSKMEPYAHEEIGKALNIPPCLVQEIEYLNDEGDGYYSTRTPEERWVRMRAWAVRKLEDPRDG